METYEKVALSILALLFSLLIFMAAFAGGFACSSYEEISERSTKYSWFAGCFVEYDGKYIPKEELVTINRNAKMEQN